MSTPEELLAVKLLVEALKAKFLPTSKTDYNDKTTCHTIDKAPGFKNVYFIKLNHNGDLAQYCPLTKNKGHRHTGTPRRGFQR